jgi:excisionase family DNA binding protein
VTGRLLTCRQVADWLGVTVETVLRWHRRGELPGFKLPGGMLRFREDDLDEWLEQHATADTATRESRDTRNRARRPGPYPVPLPTRDTHRPEEVP